MQQPYLLSNKYFTNVPFFEWVDTFWKSETEKYEPGELKDVGTSISNEFERLQNNEILEDEKDSLAFYDIWKLGDISGYGSLRLAITNPTITGIQVKTAIKTI